MVGLFGDKVSFMPLEIFNIQSSGGLCWENDLLTNCTCMYVHLMWDWKVLGSGTTQKELRISLLYFPFFCYAFPTSFTAFIYANLFLTHTIVHSKMRREMLCHLLKRRECKYQQLRWSLILKFPFRWFPHVSLCRQQFCLTRRAPLGYSAELAPLRGGQILPPVLLPNGWS